MENKPDGNIPPFELPEGIQFNTRLKMDGLEFLSNIPSNTVKAGFGDYQYRGVLDKLQYYNEGESRGKKRCSLEQMSEEKIKQFNQEICRVLKPSGHLFLWLDKFHLCEGFSPWLEGTTLETVDMITWDKEKIGMGYRSRRRSEHILVLQKKPKRAKGVFTDRSIPDVWREKIEKKEHTHAKPVELQARLIAAVTDPYDIVIDPCAGSFSVLEACKKTERNFLGCDLNG